MCVTGNRSIKEVFVSSNQRAIRLAISGLLVVFGLVSLSQAGFYVIRYFTLGNNLNSHELQGLCLSFWRGFWVVSLAVMIHFTIREIFESKIWSFFLLVSIGLTGYSFLNWYI